MLPDTQQGLCRILRARQNISTLPQHPCGHDINREPFSSQSKTGRLFEFVKVAVTRILYSKRGVLRSFPLEVESLEIQPTNLQ